MISLSIKRFITTIPILIVTYFSVFSQTTNYYKLVRKIENNISSTNVSGGQFITFLSDICYESDNSGIGVGHGSLTLNKEYSSFTHPIYLGDSYWGKNTSFKFNSDKSILNVILDNGNIYVYKKATSKSNQTTCSLIRKEKKTTTQVIYTQPQNHTYFNNTSVTINDSYPINSPNIQTKAIVKKKCAYCSGKGERVQHERVTTFGQSGPKVYCSICNNSWSYGTVHAHHKCNYCKGTGVIEYNQ